MGILDSILGNPVIGKALFGQLKGLFTERGLEFILVKLDANGEVELELHKKGESRVVTFPEGGDRNAMNGLIDGLIANRTVSAPDTLRVGKPKKGVKHA